MRSQPFLSGEDRGQSVHGFRPRIAKLLKKLAQKIDPGASRIRPDNLKLVEICGDPFDPSRPAQAVNDVRESGNVVHYKTADIAAYLAGASAKQGGAK